MKFVATQGGQIDGFVIIGFVPVASVSTIEFIQQRSRRSLWVLLSKITNPGAVFQQEFHAQFIFCFILHLQLLLLLSEIVAVYCENLTKHVSVDKMRSFIMLKQLVSIVTIVLRVKCVLCCTDISNSRSQNSPDRTSRFSRSSVAHDMFCGRLCEAKKLESTQRNEFVRCFLSDFGVAALNNGRA